MRKKVTEIIKILEKDGRYLFAQKGSHKQYKHLLKKGKVTVPDHGKNDELEHFLVDSILRQAGIKEGEI
jgi:predicted RNA binding protein YcfA (HicA-like mRNA interferase family)